MPQRLNGSTVVQNRITQTAFPQGVAAMARAVSERVGLVSLCSARVPPSILPLHVSQDRKTDALKLLCREMIFSVVDAGVVWASAELEDTQTCSTARPSVATRTIRVTEWLRTFNATFDSTRAKTTRKNAARSSVCGCHSLRAVALMPVNARGSAQRYTRCLRTLRERTAVCGPSHRAARCSRAPTAATANLTSPRHDHRDATTRPPRPHD